jgi:hypothetical protein
LPVGRIVGLRRLVFLAALSPALSGHETITTRLTWSAEISRIFERRCIRCHSAAHGESIPLTTYAEVRPWAVAIREEVLERRMPPWSAVKGFGEFQPDAGLSQEEIQRIAEWVTGGAPEGDVRLLPAMQPPAAEEPKPRGPGIQVGNGSILPGPLILTAIQPLSVRTGATVKVTAQRPDGGIEPVLWLRDYRDGKRTYVYREPLRLPRGTRIRVFPPEAVHFRLFAGSLPAK